MDGYIKLNRKIYNWEWYGDTNTCRLFIHMLIKANWQNERFEEVTIQRGSMISSIAELSEETKMTSSEVRTALKHLIFTGEISKSSYNRYTIFTVNNYDVYQGVPKSKISQQDISEQIPKVIKKRKLNKEKKKKLKKNSNEVKNKFNQFQQNSYDFNELEKEILSN